MPAAASSDRPSTTPLPTSTTPVVARRLACAVSCQESGWFTGEQPPASPAWGLYAGFPR
jgi:hypothetical protein